MMSIDFFVGDWKLYDLMNHGFGYPMRLVSGYYLLNRDDGGLIVEKYYNRRVNSDLYRVHMELRN